MPARRRGVSRPCDRAETGADLLHARTAIDAVLGTAFTHPATTPCSCRKAGTGSTRRELIIPFATSGCVASDAFAGGSSVVVVAVRHQREEDYH